MSSWRIVVVSWKRNSIRKIGFLVMLGKACRFSGRQDFLEVWNKDKYKLRATAASLTRYVSVTPPNRKVSGSCSQVSINSWIPQLHCFGGFFPPSFWKITAFEKFQGIVSRKSCLWHRTTKPHEVIKTHIVPVKCCSLSFILPHSRSNVCSIVKNLNRFCDHEMFCICFASMISCPQNQLIALYAVSVLWMLFPKYFEPRRVKAIFSKARLWEERSL